MNFLDEIKSLEPQIIATADLPQSGKSTCAWGIAQHFSKDVQKTLTFICGIVKDMKKSVDNDFALGHLKTALEMRG